MNREEIQKLIGGYATGSLTDDERRQLFEAALDDQELFDTLQEEQGLKELLDDPISREQVRRATAESLPQANRAATASWFRRPWIWAAAGTSLATAAVLLVVLVQWNPKPPVAQRQFEMARKEAPGPQVRDERSEAKIEPATPAAKSVPPGGQRTLAKKEERAPAPSVPAPPIISTEPSKSLEPAKPAEKDVTLPPPPALPVQSENQIQPPISQQSAPAPFAPQARDKMSQVGQMQNREQALRKQSVRSAEVAVPRSALAFRDTRSHSFAKRQEDGSFVDVPSGTVFHPGDTIRLTMVPGTSGPLILWEWDSATSSWKRLFPAEGETVRVRALQSNTVPVDIVVKPGERLRVTIASGAVEIPVDVR